MSMKKRLEIEVSKKQAAEFFSNLAQCLEEDKDIFEPYDIDLSCYENLKLSLKPRLTDGYNLKMTIKLSDLELSDDEYQLVVTKENYRTLKRKLEKYFQEIKVSMIDYQLPSREIVSVFVKYSEAMVQYSGYGDPHYQEYIEYCRKLQQAYNQDNFTECRKHYYAIETIKERCHSQYK